MTKINVFQPKQLEADADMNELRGTMLGACFNNHYDQIPETAFAKTCWEVLMLQ